MSTCASRAGSSGINGYHKLRCWQRANRVRVT
jgi:hypothetical protein